MWNNWVGQIQSTLGEAVEYLREEDEEGEEEEEEEEVADVPGDFVNAAPAEGHAPAAATPPPVASTTEQLAAPHVPTVPTTEEATVQASLPPPQLPPALFDGGDPVLEPHDGPDNAEGTEDSLPRSPPASEPQKANVAVMHEEDAVDESVTAVPSSAAAGEHQVAVSEVETGDSAAVVMESKEDGVASAQPLTASLTSPSASATSPAASWTTVQPLQPAAVGAAASPAVQRATTGGVVPPKSPGVDTNVTQLLRFQQQLAEEMERVSTLENTNAGLRSQVKALSEELESAKAQLVASSSSAGDVATLIEKLGREKERNKTAVAERNRLMEQVSSLQEEVEDYRVKCADVDRMQKEQEVSRQHINALETEKEQFVSQMMEVREELEAVKGVKEGLSRQLDDFERTHDTAVSQMQETATSELEYARREVERLKGALRNATVEYEDRITELENELSQANRRAHSAESRLNDVERSSVDSLRELRRELADLQQRTSVLTLDLSASRSANEELQAKYTALQREQRDGSSRQTDDTATLRAVKDNCMALEDHVAALKQELLSTQRDLESARWQVDSLKASNTHLSASLEKARQSVANGGGVSSMNRTASDSAINSPLEKSLSFSATHRSTSAAQIPLASSSLHPVTAPATVAAAVPNPFLPAHRTALEGSLRGNERGRLEKEVLRQTVEISRLRQVEVEYANLKKSHASLKVDYDLVLQMYGQAEEMLQGMQEPPTPSKEEPATVKSDTVEDEPPAST